MFSLNLSKMDDQIVMVFSDVMDEAISILQAEEVVATAASTSTRRSKRHRRYVNRDHKMAHFMLRHNYFDDDCVCFHPIEKEVQHTSHH
jgi:hypothetical protein